VIETRVFDHTAITALFRGNDAAFRVWRDADNDKLTLILPAIAVAEANTLIGGNSDTWRAILHPVAWSSHRWTSRRPSTSVRRSAASSSGRSSAKPARPRATS
jgi:hypothetical protein